MKLYKTTKGVIIEYNDSMYLLDGSWDEIVNHDDLHDYLTDMVSSLTKLEEGALDLRNDLLPPIGNQELWGSGVTYYRSREARMEEAKDAGGGDFYDKVYNAERPELFFKSPWYRVVGSGQKVRIRKDSDWNVPEPELTLFISSTGKIVGCSIGNDMSSRDIEGENPLYLPQAKTYDGSAALGPCLLVTKKPLPETTKIRLSIERQGKIMFEGDTEISQIKRKFQQLADFLFRELTFPNGVYLMTGTGVVPDDDFTLLSGDVISIAIDEIGTLVNTVE